MSATAGHGVQSPAGVSIEDTGPAGAPAQRPVHRLVEACPLCGAPLAPSQDWCMRCGAAARTRLAAAPNWRVPVAVLLAVVVLALAAIAAAAVKLAGQTNAPPPILRTVTTAVPAAPATPAPAPGAATPTTGAGATTTPVRPGATPTTSTRAPATPAAPTTSPRAPVTPGTPGAGTGG